jgi:RNA polymerase sigma factor (sigma-70 family)
MRNQDLFQLELSDEILAAHIVRRDTNALEMIYDRYSSKVFTLAAMLSDCAQAERIVLQVFSRVWLDIDRFETYEGTFQDWLLNLTRSNILKRLARNNGLTAQDRVNSINRWLADAASRPMQGGEELLQPRSNIPVWQALQDLTLEQRCVIILAGYGGFKQTEIARLLSLPLTIVEQHIRLGLPRLRDSVLSERENEYAIAI